MVRVSSFKGVLKSIARELAGAYCGFFPSADHTDKIERLRNRSSSIVDPDDFVLTCTLPLSDLDMYAGYHTKLAFCLIAVNE